ncbi:hypothetical protein M9458_056076, partial [Cirrhinus mrigala]
IMGKKLPLHFVHDVRQMLSVTVFGDVTLPPRSEVIITGVVEGEPQSVEGMLEPGTLTKGDALVARIVFKVDNGKLPVRVINVAEDPLTLKQGMTLGTLVTDVEVGGEGLG